jgi:serine/threonine protein kinase
MFEEFQFGNYKLVKRLAASASSEVFLGIPGAGRMAGRLVVIKRLLPEMAKIDTFAELLSNEAKLGEVMNHPNVVKIFEYGSTGSELYLAMEYVDGLDLWRLMRRTRKSGRQMSQLQMLYITAEVLKALSYLHSLEDDSGSPLDIVHHDVSPSNVLVSRIGEVKLGDFGISFSQHKNLPDAERKVRFRGKVHYISPEQIKGQPADGRSDIFSLGVVMAEMVLGRKPFEGPTDLSIMINIKDGRSRLASSTADSLPRPLYAIMAKALANDPEERYQDAREMLGGIEDFAGADKLFDAGIRLGELVNLTIREVDKTPPPRPSPLFAVKVEDEKSVPQVGGEFPTIQPEQFSQEILEDSQKTPLNPIREHLVKKVDGQILGIMPLSTVIEYIIGDRITEDDLVSVGGKPFERVGSIPDLAKHLPSVTPTTKIHDLGAPDRRGIICSDESVARIFYAFFQMKETGLLILECASVRKEIFLEEGSPSYASSNLAGELLGEFLVKRGIINRMELDLALAMMDRFSGHLGETLIGLDILDSITLLNAITEQIKMRIFDIYTWDSGAYSFFKHAKYLREGFRLAVDPLELIRDGFLFAFSDDDAQIWFAEHKNKLLQLSEDVSVIDEWKIEVPHRSILATLEKPLPLFEIANAGPTLDEKGVMRLSKLICFGMEVGFIKEIK